MGEKWAVEKWGGKEGEQNCSSMGGRQKTEAGKKGRRERRWRLGGKEGGRRSGGRKRGMEGRGGGQEGSSSQA